MGFRQLLARQPVTGGLLIFVGVVLAVLLIIKGLGTVDVSLFSDLTATDVLPLIIGLSAIAVTIWLPLWLTKAPPKSTAPKEPVEELLSDPHLRRTIMRLNIGGTLAGVTALIFAIWGLHQANYQSQLAETALRDQKISSAWQIISQTGSTSSGKAYALDILANETKEPLVGLDLSCQDFVDAAAWDDPNADQYVLTRYGCRTPTQLSERAFGSDERGELFIRSSSFALADFNQVEFRNAALSFVDFTRIDARGLDFSNADLWMVNFSDAWLHNTRFDHVGLVGPKFTGAHMSDARFAHSSLFYADFSNMGNSGITLADSGLFTADFTAFDFSTDLLKFEGQIYFDPQSNQADLAALGIRFVDGAYGSNRPMFNVSSATFCQIADGSWTKADGGEWEQQVSEGETKCWSHLSQDFLDNAYFWEGFPPKGLHLADPGLRIRNGCTLPAELAKERDFDQYNFAEDACFSGELVAVSELEIAN